MKCFYHPDQALHAPPTFLLRGQPVPSPEGPVRAELLTQGLARSGLTLSVPKEADSPTLRKRLEQIHTPCYLTFLDTIYARWQALPNASEFVAPNIHPCGGGHHYPRHPIGQAGWHLHDMACPLSATSFQGALASAATAEAAAEEVLNGAPTAYALCRPPGHHAGPERAGGFCLLNNSALAATVLRERYGKVAIIDVDLHHGNGTQDIFYYRSDVWTGSLHADPSDFYPFFWGGAEEEGSDEGVGANVNLPLPVGSDGDVYLDALAILIDHLQRYEPGAVVVALGLDAHKDDPLAGLKVETEAFIEVGKRLAALSLPMVIVQEGGYPTEHLSANLTAFMQGFYGMSRTGFYWHERCFWHDQGAIGVFSAPGEFLQPQAASESPESKRRLKNILEVSGLIDELYVVKPPAATLDDLLRFHTPRYLDKLQAGDRARGGNGGDCAPYMPGSWAAATQSAGLAVAAVEAVALGEVSNAYALCRPPGHHAEADQGRGFCLLGNIPVAVMRARALGQVNRVAILDWDVHHGNGQQAAFYNDPEVFTVSLHQAANYPLETGGFDEQGEGAGLGANLNLPLPPGCGLGAYAYAMGKLVLPALEAFNPDLIVVACGYGACAKDPLGKMLLNSQAFATMTAQLKALAERCCEGKLVFVHEGGYSEGYVPLCGHAVIQTLAGSAIAVPDPQNDEIAAWGYQALQPHQQALIDDWCQQWEQRKQ